MSKGTKKKPQPEAGAKPAAAVKTTDQNLSEKPASAVVSDQPKQNAPAAKTDLTKPAGEKKNADGKPVRKRLPAAANRSGSAPAQKPADGKQAVEQNAPAGKHFAEPKSEHSQKSDQAAPDTVKEKHAVAKITERHAADPKPSGMPETASKADKAKKPEHSEKEKRKRVTLLAVLATVVLAIAGLSLWVYRYTHFEMFGQQTDIFAEEIQLRGNEISDLDALRSYLRRFKNLKKADLGAFRIEAEEAFPLKQEFPNTEFVYDTVVDIEGKDYETDITTLDISDHGFTDAKTFMRKLDYLPDLKTVIFGDITIPETEKEMLQEAYSDVSFEVIGTYEIYGKTVLENTEELDLRDVKLDASLCDQLALLQQLRFVDLHDQPLTIEEKVELAEQFPEVSFGWEVKYDGETYDSTITEWDLTGKKLKEEDLDALKEAVSQFPQLEKLILCECGLPNETLAELREELDGINVVWRIYLGTKWSLRTDAVAFSVLIVHYDYPRMTSESIQPLKYCTDLRALDLGHQAISDLSVIGDYLPELRLLILADNQVRDLTPLTKLKHLHYLELFVNKISDISPLKELHELVDVNISYNGGLYDIEPLLYSPMMERIWLESTSVGGNGFALLEETYPEAKIVRFGSGSVDQGWRWGHPRYEQMMDMWFNDYYGDEFSKFDEKAKELGLTD